MRSGRNEMTKRRRRRQKKTSFSGEIFRFIFAIIMIVVAVFVVLFVVRQVKGITGSLGETPAGPSEAQTELAIENESQEIAPGFYQDAEGNRRWRISQEEGDAQDQWIAYEKDLYYFNEAGLMQTGTKGIEGMIYTFGSDGSLERIQYNPDYSPEESTIIKDYPSLVSTKRLWAFLQPGEKLGSFSALMYKKTTEATAHQLGGTDNPQYTGPYSMQIDGDYIYFLPLSQEEELTEAEEKINGILYRMKPGDTKRQIVARDVEGYKVLEGTVWYYADGRLQQTATASEDDTTNPKRTVSSGDEVYTVEIMDGAAYLVDSGGTMVTEAEDGTLKGRGFTYYLNEDGTIRGVKEKTTVNTGGYTYYAESDTAFGTELSRMMRRDSQGNQEIISAEFAGRVGNIHYDYDTGAMIAEYTDGKGIGGILRITKNGDVDKVLDETAKPGSLTLIGVQNGQAVCMRESGGETEYLELGLYDTAPLAVGIDPIPEEGAVISETPSETEAPTETETKAPEPEAPETKAPAETTAAPEPAAPTEPPAETNAPEPTAALMGPDQAVVGGAPQ